MFRFWPRSVPKNGTNGTEHLARAYGNGTVPFRFPFRFGPGLFRFQCSVRRCILITFEIPGPPVGKGRARVARRGRFTTMYTPEKTASYESLVAMSAHQAMQGRAMLLDAVAVTLDIRVPIPASWSQKKQAAAIAGQIRPTTKPDIDNVEKAIFDGLNGVAWKDDVQVVRVTKEKRYAPAPGVAVTIRSPE